MQQPRLIIIAGCNGSGKSTYSSSIVGNTIEPFDYDLRYSQYYKELPDSEFRENIAKTHITNELENLVKESFKNKTSFCFETNLMTIPFEWISQGKALNFKIEIYFFCLIDIQKAKERVLIRAKNNGHYVEDSIIEYKWKEGYKNINNHYHLVDRVVFLDNSNDEAIPVFLFELNKIAENKYEFIQYCEELPEYTQRRLPNIFNFV